MKINKEGLKKVGKTAFYVLGTLSIVFTIIFLLVTVIPSSKSTGDSDSIESGNRLQALSEGSSPSEDYARDETSGADEENKEIKTGSISLLVDDIDVAREAIEDIKDEYSGEFTYSYESGEGSDRNVSLVLKIEVSKFEEAFEKISDVEGEIDYLYTNTTDVTEEYTDLQSRLTNLEAVEDQLLEILEDAETVEDTLAVYTELASTRSEIEVLEGQIKYLDNQTEYSYITIVLEISSMGGDIAEEEWKPIGVAKDALRSLVSFLETLGNLLIWILMFSPIGLIAFGIYWLVAKRAQKSKK